MTAAEWLARAHAVTDGATSGPWSDGGDGHVVRVIVVTRLDGAGSPYPAQELELVAQTSGENVPLIAASRTMLPAAVAALEAVPALHRPVWHPDDADGYHCDECGADLTDTTPDCPTVAALTAHLDPS